MPARALDTTYNGYKFRSRLEARWAVFFDAARIEYLYELEGFEVADEVYYLPDFYLINGVRYIGEGRPRYDVWVEIKPTTEISDEERQKIAGFVRSTGKNLLLIAGDPGLEANIKFVKLEEDGKLSADEVGWIELKGEEVGLVSLELLASIQDETKRETARKFMASELLVGAYDRARQARFEREEKTRECENCGKEFVPYKHYHYLCSECYSTKNGRRRSKKSTKANELPLKLRLVIVGILMVFLIVLLGWATYQILNAPNWLFQ